MILVQVQGVSLPKCRKKQITCETKAEKCVKVVPSPVYCHSSVSSLPVRTLQYTVSLPHPLFGRYLPNDVMNWCNSLMKALPDVRIRSSTELRTASNMCSESSGGAKWAGVEFPTGYNPHVQAMRLTMASALDVSCTSHILSIPTILGVLCMSQQNLSCLWPSCEAGFLGQLFF